MSVKSYEGNRKVNVNVNVNPPLLAFPAFLAFLAFLAILAISLIASKVETLNCTLAYCYCCFSSELLLI